jgi:hypothetical protein
MKAVFMGILGILVYLLIPAIFGGVGAGVFFWVIQPRLEAGKILKNGVETTATVTDIESAGTVSSKSGSTTKTERFNKLKLSFVNSEGNEIEYKTRGIYPDGFIRKNKINKNETVQVMYVGAKAVVKGFVPEYETWLWLFPVVFGAIAAGFLMFLALGFVWTASDSIIKKFGEPVTGTYLEHKKFMNGDDSNMNSIICSFKNDNGNTVEVKTRFIYSNAEAEELAKMGSFPVIYKGKKAVIMVDKTK